MDNILGNLKASLLAVASDCCESICKFKADFMERVDYSSDPEGDYERLSIEHCEECPLNKLGVWAGDDWNDFGS